MIDEDDDLPVLTQVLRTAGGHPPYVSQPAGRASLVLTPIHAPHHASVDDFGVGPRVEPGLAPPLVIGIDSEAGHGIDAYAIADRFAATPRDPVADPRRVERPYGDAFSSTVPTGPSSSDALDEPHLVAASAAGASTAMPDPYVTIATGSSSLADEIRAQVLEDLRARIDTELDARIAHTLHAGVESALGLLQAQLREELGAALRDVVARAVDEAVAQRRFSDTTRH